MYEGRGPQVRRAGAGLRQAVGGPGGRSGRRPGQGSIFPRGMVKPKRGSRVPSAGRDVAALADARVDGGAKKLPAREEIDAAFQWRVEDIFSSPEGWEAAYAEAEGLLDQAGRHQGRLGDGAEHLLACLRWLEEVSKGVALVYTYAMLRHDENTADSDRQAIYRRAQTLRARAHQATSFVRPEILALPKETIDAYLAENEELALYRQYLDDLMRRKEHVLPPEMESLLAMGSEVARVPYQVFTMLNDADLKFPVIEDEDGAAIEVTRGRYSTLLQRSSRQVRQAAFEAFTGTYGRVQNTLAASLEGAVKVNIFQSRARKYPSALAAALHDEAIDPKVYDNLVQAINENLAPLHRYMELRRQRLQLPKLKLYDLMVPLVTGVDFTTTYPQAQHLVREALAPLGPEYAKPLEEALSGGWIDVYENQGKRGGAYSMGGAYGVHPYILMNWQDNLDSVFTLAHELGHTIHSYFSQRHQPYIYAGYTIFVAEVASTVNEGLLVHHLLRTEKDPLRRAYILNHYLEEFRRTVYAQVLLAEFEQRIHQQAEEGQPLTAQGLTSLYGELAQRYWGPAVDVDAESALGWAWIPHFYYGFYVYKYAVGFSAATAIVEQILAQGDEAVDRYLNFLKSGSSDYSIPLLQRAGVDLLSPEPIHAALGRFSQVLAEFEEALAALPGGRLGSTGGAGTLSPQ